MQRAFIFSISPQIFEAYPYTLKRTPDASRNRTDTKVIDMTVLTTRQPTESIDNPDDLLRRRREKIRDRRLREGSLIAGRILSIYPDSASGLYPSGLKLAQ